MEKISWEAPEHSHREKGPEWYWSVSIITVGIAISAILLQNYFFAILIALSSFTLMMFASKKPRIVECEINKDGVVFERYFYPYRSLRSFWVDEDAPEPVLLLQHGRFFMPYIVISLEHVNHESIRNFLSDYLDEEEHQEPIFQKILESLGF